MPDDKQSGQSEPDEFTAESQRRAGRTEKPVAASDNDTADDAAPEAGTEPGADAERKAEVWRDPNVTGGRRG